MLEKLVGKKIGVMLRNGKDYGGVLMPDPSGLFAHLTLDLGDGNRVEIAYGEVASILYPEGALDV